MFAQHILWYEDKYNRYIVKRQADYDRLCVMITWNCHTGIPMEFGRFGELVGAMKEAKEAAVAAA